MPDFDTPDLAQFITTARERGLTTAVIAWQEEYNQVPGESAVRYDRIAYFTVLAYHKPSSTVIRYHQLGSVNERAAVISQLKDAGFSVEERSRNEVKYRKK